MKRLIASFTLLAAFAMSASAQMYFDGSFGATSGPGGYRGTKLDLTIGSGNLAIEPSMATYSSNALDKTFRTYGVRGAWEADLYTLGAEAGTTPKVNNYSNNYVGADITFSLTPGSGGKSRLTGPAAHGATRGGAGVTRLDVGASVKQTIHTQVVASSDRKTSQTQASLFAGAKVLMANISASYTGYTYGDENSPTDLTQVPGLNFYYNAFPKASFNARVDLPAFLIVTPFVSYTGTSYKHGVKDSSAYLLGAYVDLTMITANVGWQLFDNGTTRDSFLSIGAGLKF